MNDQRPIRFSTRFKVMMGNKPFFLMGLIFICLFLFLAPLLAIITKSSKVPYENYDFKAIEKNGIETTATVTDIEVLYNTTINGVHPKVISYNYYLDGQPFADQFKTLTALNNMLLNVKDAIKIKVFNKQSIIENLKPFNFPFYIFYFIPFIFFLVGIPLLLQGFYLP